MNAAVSSAELKRLTLRLTEKDAKRFKIVLANKSMTAQDVLTEALNAWLVAAGEKPLEGIV